MYRCTMLLAHDNETDLRDVMETNVYGVLLCTKAAYRLMKKYKTIGHIININCLFGHEAVRGQSRDVVPMVNIYPSSKFALHALTDVIRQELNFFKIKTIKISVRFNCLSINM